MAGVYMQLCVSSCIQQLAEDPVTKGHSKEHLVVCL